MTGIYEVYIKIFKINECAFERKRQHQLMAGMGAVEQEHRLCLLGN